MGNLAIIPARGGSRRIPRKNIRKFLGKPVIAYSIETAIESGLFAEVMVSTDDEEIAEIAKKYGASVPFMRSDKNSDDHATTCEAIIEVLNAYQKRGFVFDKACCIYPAAPLLKTAHLNKSYQLLDEGNFDAVFPVVEFGYPIQRSLKKDSKGRVSMNWPEYYNSRSQDLSKAYHDAGQFYWIRIRQFLTNPVLFGNNSGCIELKHNEAQDIDTMEDWELAELKAKLL